MIPALEKRYLWFMVAAALLGALLALLATRLYGPGVSADATKYLSIAENLRLGNGFFDHTGRPLLWWPPLYPIILAGLTLLTGADVLPVGGYFNIALLAINIFLHGVLLALAFKDKLVYAYIGTLIVLTSDMAIRIHANIASEPLFVTFSLIFLIASVDYLQTQSRRAFWWMVAMAALACLQRYLGASLIAAGGVFILYANWRQWSRVIREGLLFGVLSILPIALWIGFHNLGIYGSFWGVSGSIVDPIENLRLSLAKILHWFLPFHPTLQPLFDRPWIVIAIAMIIILLINKRENWQAGDRALMQPVPFVSWVFVVWTILGLMYSVTTEDHVDLFSDRYYVGLLSQMLIILFVVIDTMVLPHLKTNAKLVQYSAAAVFALWLAVYPVWSLVKYISQSMERGEASGYNVYNNAEFHNHPLVSLMQVIAQDDPSATFYSNYTDGVWFFARRESPVTPRSFTMELTEIEQNYAGWPAGKPGYLFWFLPNSIYRHAVPPKLLAEIANLELLYEFEEGEVYRVRARE